MLDQHAVAPIRALKQQSVMFIGHDGLRGREARFAVAGSTCNTMRRGVQKSERVPCHGASVQLYSVATSLSLLFLRQSDQYLTWNTDKYSHYTWNDDTIARNGDKTATIAEPAWPLRPLIGASIQRPVDHTLLITMHYLSSISQRTERTSSQPSDRHLRPSSSICWQIGTCRSETTIRRQTRWLTLFGHICAHGWHADAKRILTASPPADWRNWWPKSAQTIASL